MQNRGTLACYAVATVIIVVLSALISEHGGHGHSHGPNGGGHGHTHAPDPVCNYGRHCSATCKFNRDNYPNEFGAHLYNPSAPNKGCSVPSSDFRYCCCELGQYYGCPNTGK